MNKIKHAMDMADIGRFRLWLQVFFFLLLVYGGVLPL